MKAASSRNTPHSSPEQFTEIFFLRDEGSACGLVHVSVEAKNGPRRQRPVSIIADATLGTAN
jgi:hypothetical protein